MTGIEFMAVATIGMAAIGEVVSLASEHGPAIIDQVKSWFQYVCFTVSYDV